VLESTNPRSGRQHVARVGAQRTPRSEPVTISVNENIPGDVRILNSNYTLEKTSATTWRFHVRVDQNGESVLRYRVRMKN